MTRPTAAEREAKRAATAFQEGDYAKVPVENIMYLDLEDIFLDACRRVERATLARVRKKLKATGRNLLYLTEVRRALRPERRKGRR